MTKVITIALTPLEDDEQHWLALHACQTWRDMHRAIDELLDYAFHAQTWSLYLRTDAGLTRIESNGARKVGSQNEGEIDRSPDSVTAIPRDSLFDIVVPLGPIDGRLMLTTGSMPREAQLNRLAAHMGVAVARVVKTERLRVETNRDATTGLLNARSLRDSLRRELMRGQRYGHPVSVLFLDLDRFKAVNDRHGHLEGTALLRNFALRLKNAIRKVDIAFRYGGDEFVLLLVQTSRDAAERAAHRLKAELSNAPFCTTNAEALTITVSIGVAAFPEDGEKVELLLRAADRALYRAKAKGRNEIVSTENLERFDA
ncbi:MAG: GGDEF domain-containing protein [Myxococcota bacterium]